MQKRINFLKLVKNKIFLSYATSFISLEIAKNYEIDFDYILVIIGIIALCNGCSLTKKELKKSLKK